MDTIAILQMVQETEPSMGNTQQADRLDSLSAIFCDVVTKGLSKMPMALSNARSPATVNPWWAVFARPKFLTLARRSASVLPIGIWTLNQGLPFSQGC